MLPKLTTRPVPIPELHQCGRREKFLAVVTIAGALAICLGFPNAYVRFPVLILLWPVALCCLALNAGNFRRAFLLGWICTFAGMCGAMYWLAFPVHDVGGLPLPLALVCAGIICAILAFQGAFFCFLACLFERFPVWILIIILSCCWYLLEYGFALFPAFPWLPLAGALAEWLPLVQFAEYTGAYALSALWVLASLCVFFALPRNRLRSFAASGHACPSWTLACAGLLLACLLCLQGYCRLNERPLSDAETDSFDVLMAQGNIDQNQKWLPAFQQKSLETYMFLSREGLENSRLKRPLLIWPETALPFFFEVNTGLQLELRDFVAGLGVPLLFGAPGLERAAAGEEIYNRAFLLDARGQTIGHYDKEHLVPFGEYTPAWLKWPFLEALLQGVGVYSEGTAVAPLHLDGLALGILICYEGIFPWLAQERVEQGANVLVDISNDAWFGDSPASRQHLLLTILRSIEQSRWLVRSTNTGISVIANPRGQLVLRGRQFREEWLAGQAFTSDRKTVFHQYGKWYPLAAIVLISVLLLLQLHGKPIVARHASSQGLKD